MRNYQTLIFLGLALFTCNTNALVLATWNMQWLTTKSDIDDGIRNKSDYHALNQIAEKLDASVIAVQEIDSKEALSKVFSKEKYHYFLSDRSKKSPLKGSQQFTGWVVDKKIEVTDHKDEHRLSLSQVSRLRYGAYIQIKTPKYPSIHLLSVHLKSGCFSRLFLAKSQKKKSCRILLKQLDALSLWIKDRISQSHYFMVMGDFNHTLAENEDWFWQKLMVRFSDSELINLSANTKGKCKVRRKSFRTTNKKFILYTKLIDHILASPKLFAKQEVPKAKQFVYSSQLLHNYSISDHCPVYVSI